MPYGLWKGVPTNVKHFIIFGSKCYIKMEDNKGGKFYSPVDEGIFVGYSWKSKAYKCYNLRLNKIVESINVKFDESRLLKTKRENKKPYMLDDKMNVELRQEEEEEEEEEKQDGKHPEEEQGNNQQQPQTPYKTPECWVHRNHPP
jgi:hypothetical protein